MADAQILHCRFFPHRVCFRRTIKCLPGQLTAMPNMHVGDRKFCLSGLQQASAIRPSVLDIRHFNKGGTAVDTALRLNVLAVCAVFLFVGAVLLGAF